MTQKFESRHIIFVALTSITFLTSYFVFISMNNVFQYYAFSHSLPNSLVPYLHVNALRLATFVLLLCSLRCLQSVERQRFLMLALMLCLIIGLLISPSLKTYTITSGCSNAIFNLMEPWRQLYVPPALRATFEGINEGLTGPIELSSIFIQQGWSQHLERYRYVAVVIMSLMVLFWYLTHILKEENSGEKSTVKQEPETILNLLKKYPYVFIVCIFTGINEGIFHYAFLLGKGALPHLPPHIYQYVICSAGIIGPMLSGRLGDKKGIFFIIMLFATILICILATTATLAFYDIPTSLSKVYYGLVFIEAWLAASLSALSIAFVGERLRTKGIFRAFAMSNVFFSMGSVASSRIHAYFAHSFLYTKTSLVLLDCIILYILYYFYRKNRDEQKVFLNNSPKKKTSQNVV